MTWNSSVSAWMRVLNVPRCTTRNNWSAILFTASSGPLENGYACTHGQGSAQQLKALHHASQRTRFTPVSNAASNRVSTSPLVRQCWNMEKYASIRAFARSESPRTRAIWFKQMAA